MSKNGPDPKDREIPGKADAGTVRTDTLERMTAEGKIDIKDFKIINIDYEIT